MTSRLSIRFIVLAAAALLASCGGGSGDLALGISNTGPSATPEIDSFTATLSGAEQTPPNGSAARASGSASFNRVSRVLQVALTTSAITGTAAHVHEGAPGTTGAILLPLTQGAAGNWTGQIVLNAPQVDALLAGNLYIDVHSAAFPNGEIRGQLVVQRATSPTPTGGGALTGVPGAPTIGLPSPPPISSPVPATTGSGGFNIPSPFGSGAGTGIGSIGGGSTGIGSAGIGSTGIGSTGIGSTGIGSTGIGSTGIGSTGIGSTGTGSTGTGSTGIGSSGTSSGFGSTSIGNTGNTSGLGTTGTGTGMGTSGIGTIGTGTTGTTTPGSGAVLTIGR